MGRGVRYYGLTLSQLCRLTACEREEVECGAGGLTRDQVAVALEVEQSQAGRFVREMVKRGWMYCEHRPETRGLKGNVSTYRMHPDWEEVSERLRRRGVLPDLCQWPGCDEKALPLRFRGKFWCSEHLQRTHCHGCTRRAEDGKCPKVTPNEEEGDHDCHH